MNIFQILQSKAESNPEAIAIQSPDCPGLSYGALHKQVQEVGTTLRSMGLQRNDRVAIVLPNGPEMAVAFLSVSAWATSAPLNPSYRAREFGFYLSDLDAKALILPQGSESPALSVARTKRIPIIELSVLPGSSAGVFSLLGEGPSKGSAAGSPLEHAQAADIALVLHTSGTTSRPKIVPLTHLNICTSAGNISVSLALSEVDRCLNVMPLFHIHGLIGALLSSIDAGASVICTLGFDALKFFGWVEASYPTWYTAVPTMHQLILSRAANNMDIVKQHPLRFIRSCSASLPPSVMADLEAVFHAPVLEAYGMTEASHQMACNPLPPRDQKPGSVGVSTGTEIATMDEVGLLPRGEIGEIVIRGENVFQGYENNPIANREAFTDGWFRTGDEGYIDRDDYLFLTGRIKEIINRGGEKISPREVDEVLLGHAGIAQAVTFSIKHSTLGEDVAAAVVLREGNEVTETELREFIAGRLAPYKVPRKIEFLDEIPKGPTGKVQRIGLADKLGL
jgi:acyl-CoA synthetase (AMP-forming)/AMP-acid ligase II